MKTVSFPKPEHRINKEIDKMFLLLRRVYNTIEMNHLTDHKLSTVYYPISGVSKQLGEDIFNYLQSKDQDFRNIVIKRQKRYRHYQKKLSRLEGVVK